MQPQEDADELAKFREEWKAEVRRNKLQSHSAEPAPSTDASGTHDGATSHISSSVTKSPKSVAKSVSPAIPPRTSLETSPSAPPSLPKHSTGIPQTGDAPSSASLAAAVEVYRRAVACEQRSELDEAIKLYRTAFRMNSHVDRAYHTLEARLQHPSSTTAKANIAGAPQSQAHHRRKSSSVDISRGSESLAKILPYSTPGPGVAKKALAKLISAWPRVLTFEPEDEREPMPIGSLPDELLVYILRCLDTAALERFAAVNRKARVISLDAEIWRGHVEATYKPPLIPFDEDVESLSEMYMADYRRLYIEHPRVRMDGVYIAVCHYIRNGLSENPWVNISHLITYHRYLRFYPDGQVLSLLANEEVSPQHIIPLLKPGLRMKGFFIGNWRLVGTTVVVTDLTDPGGISMQYTFQMTLELRSRPIGRWNRLDFQAYDSVNVLSGETTPVALKHDRPFWFSKVRSYVG